MKKAKLFNLFFCTFLCVGWSVAQNASLSGTVKDTDGTALYNVKVVIDGTGKGAITDDRGLFSIKGVPPGSYTVTAKLFEYQDLSQEVTLSQEPVILDFVMKMDQVMDEVVVIGYGTMRSKDLTGSAVVVGEKNFVKGSMATPEQLIMGKVSGLKVNTNDGAPGSGSTIRLRGGTSINASNDPLIVVDGVPLDNGGIAGAANPLSLINPNDIASFVVLKDASATAIYGSRGANGVILITTKKGNGLNTEKLKVTLNSKSSISTISKYADVLSADQFREVVGQNGTNAQSALLGDASTDWQREVFRSSFVADNNVSLTGGIKNFPYRLSFGNRMDNGLLKRDRMMRNSLSLNINPSLFDKHLNIEVNQKLVQTNSFFANRGALGAAYFDPTQPVYSDTTIYGGYWEWLDNNDKPNTLSARNPVGLLNQKEDVSRVQRYIANAKLSYKLHFFPMIKAVINVGTDLSQGSGDVLIPSTSASGYFTDGSYNEYRSTKQNKLFESYLNFNNGEKNSKHLVDITAGYSYQDWSTESPNLPVYNAAQDSVIYPEAANPFYTKNVLLSYYGRGIYSIADRYVLNASVRMDGSSRFSPETRWGLFPSASAAWIISEEKFMEDLSWLNMLKFRFGYGVTGQQDGIGDYAYISNYFEGTTTAQYLFGGVPYIVYRPGGFDANLKWEETESYNIGLDFGILKDRVSGSLDFYRKNTTDLLATVTVPAGTNFTNEILTNVGSMRNEGIEFSINAGLVAKKDFRLDMTANVSHNINQVLKLTQIPDSTSAGILLGGISGGIGNTVQVHRVGFPTFSFLLYEQQYDVNGAPIQAGTVAPDGTTYTELDAFVDRNEDGVINIDDRIPFGQAAPDVFMGMALNFTYKKWFGGLSMRSELGGYIYNNIHSNAGTFQSINGTQGFLSNISSLYYEDETQEITTNQLLSDHYLERADFLRMDFMNIGYNFGKLKSSNIGLNVSFVVQNVFVLTNYKGLDPEIGGGIDNNIYPRPRMYSLNLNFEF